MTENQNCHNNIRIRRLPESVLPADLELAAIAIFNQLLEKPKDSPIKLDRIHHAKPWSLATTWCDMPSSLLQSQGRDNACSPFSGRNPFQQLHYLPATRSIRSHSCIAQGPAPTAWPPAPLQHQVSLGISFSTHCNVRRKDSYLLFHWWFAFLAGETGFSTCLPSWLASEALHVRIHLSFSMVEATPQNIC